jgi:hypothetical protein
MSLLVCPFRDIRNSDHEKSLNSAKFCLKMRYGIKRNSTEFLVISHGIRKRRKCKKLTEFHVDGTPWTPYLCLFLKLVKDRLIQSRIDIQYRRIRQYCRTVTHLCLYSACTHLFIVLRKFILLFTAIVINVDDRTSLIVC